MCFHKPFQNVCIIWTLKLSFICFWARTKKGKKFRLTFCILHAKIIKTMHLPFERANREFIKWLTKALKFWALQTARYPSFYFTKENYCHLHSDNTLLKLFKLLDQLLDLSPKYHSNPSPFSYFSLFYCNSQIQKALGCKRNPLAYDITAACSGFVLGLVSAACHIRGKNFTSFVAFTVNLCIHQLTLYVCI